jgi:hypothetical protein
MALISKVTNLISSANSLADQATTAAKIVGCIPAILGNLPSILGGVASNILKTVAAEATLIAKGMVDAALNIVQSALDTAVGIAEGYIKRILQLQATILGTIESIKEFFKGLQERAEDIKKFVSDEENCKFAAASLLNCVAGSLLKDFTNDIKKKINSKIYSVEDYVNTQVNKLSEPGELYDKYASKAGAAVDKANSQVSALTLF